MPAAPSAGCGREHSSLSQLHAVALSVDLLSTNDKSYSFSPVRKTSCWQTTTQRRPKATDNAHASFSSSPPASPLGTPTSRQQRRGRWQQQSPQPQTVPVRRHGGGLVQSANLPRAATCDPYEGTYSTAATTYPADTLRLLAWWPLSHRHLRLLLRSRAGIGLASLPRAC
jgi:hypothetical protein